MLREFCVLLSVSLLLVGCDAQTIDPSELTGIWIVRAEMKGGEEKPLTYQRTQEFFPDGTFQINESEIITYELHGNRVVGIFPDGERKDLQTILSLDGGTLEINDLIVGTEFRLENITEYKARVIGTWKKIGQYQSGKETLYTDDSDEQAVLDFDADGRHWREIDGVKEGPFTYTVKTQWIQCASDNGRDWSYQIHSVGGRKMELYVIHGRPWYRHIYERVE